MEEKFNVRHEPEIDGGRGSILYMRVEPVQAADTLWSGRGGHRVVVGHDIPLHQMGPREGLPSHRDMFGAAFSHLIM